MSKNYILQSKSGMEGSLSLLPKVRTSLCSISVPGVQEVPPNDKEREGSASRMAQGRMGAMGFTGPTGATGATGITGPYGTRGYQDSSNTAYAAGYQLVETLY